jgi:mono/diheme cytochrome c family protein
MAGARRAASASGRSVLLSCLCVLGQLALLAGACNPGPYTIDFFSEMHYTQEQRRLEPRRLSPPDDAVPVSGGRPDLTFDQAASLANPLPGDERTLARGRQVYAINCAACHGADGHSHTLMADQFAAAGEVRPVDFASPRVRARTDGQLYWLIEHGRGGMPPFRDLVGENDTWTLVGVIRAMQGR